MAKKIYKSSTNKIFTGTCGGFGEYFDLDPLFIRIIFVILIFAGTSGIWIYLVAAMLMPSRPAEDFDQFETIDDEDEYVSMKEEHENGSADVDDNFDSYFEK